MHHKIREQLNDAIATNIISFSDIGGNGVICRRSEIQKLEYIDDGHNIHIVKVGGKLYRVKYSQLQKLKAFLAQKEAPIRTDLRK